MDDTWELAGETLLAMVGPTRTSQSTRTQIVKCTIEMLENGYDSKVFVFGSFLLKTYLPCGDIDVTMAVSSNPESIHELASFLEKYNVNNGGDSISIQVTKVIAKAAVPLVKCLINNVPFDISLNALGGVSSLAFLEEVDAKIGRNHLFKRSIILIKAWFKYVNETDILKSSEGMLSTYALNVMILYIINRFFHIEVKTPLQCLVRFLAYYSSFNWEEHSLTIRGPIYKISSSLVEPDANLLLDEGFLQNTESKCSFGQSEKNLVKKAMIIIDPMDTNNNLAKSVSNKDQVIDGLIKGSTRLSGIEESNDVLKYFSALTSQFSASPSNELIDLQGDSSEMQKSLEEAKKLHIKAPISASPNRFPANKGGHLDKSNSNRTAFGYKQSGMENAEMAGDRRVLMIGGKGPSLSSTSVFKFATASPPQILKIDPSALARLSSSPSGRKLKSPSSPFKLQLSVPDYLTPEEAKASILLLLNMLLLGGSVSPSTASQLSDILNNDAQTLTLDLEFDRQADVDLFRNCWPDIISQAICALLDYAASSLSKVVDAVAALSCEALKTDTTTAFNIFTDSGDGFSDKDRASVASDFKVLLNGSKMRGNTPCDLVLNIPRTHGSLRSLCKSIHSSTRVELNSIPSVHEGASKDLTGSISSLAFALQSLGEYSWRRAKLCLDNLVKDNLFPNLVESFNAGCPNVEKLKDSVMSFVTFKMEESYIKSLHEVYSLTEAVRKILAWEATISFISLEGSELINVKEVADGTGAKPDEKQDKKKKALGKGTAVLMQFIKDRLQSVTSNIDASSLPEKLSNGFLSFLDLKDNRFDQFLQKVKEVVASNESRRLPKIPKGTRNFAKEQMAVREKAFSIVANVFKRHGAMTLDIPVELRETHQGGELCSLRYEPRVPFARFVAMNDIKSFRRYQMTKVYGRDKQSKGRSCEFYQCDFDIVGDESIGADFEVVKILTESLDELNIGEYEIRLNHRKLLDGMLDICGVPSYKFRIVCSSIDKLDKQTFQQIKKELIDEKGLDTETVDKIGSFLKRRGQPLELLSQLKKEGSEFLTNDSSKQALNDLDKLFHALDSAGCVDKVVFDLSLAGGLDYYTGVIFEAVFKGATQVGSIAAGGRYDDLISKFGSKHIAAIGVSLGIERVFTIMEQNKKYDKQLLRASETQVLVSILGDDYNLAAKLVSMCWDANLKAKFLVNKRLNKHLDCAKEFGIPWIVMVGKRDITKGVVTLENKDAKVQKEVPADDFVIELVSLMNTRQSKVTVKQN